MVNSPCSFPSGVSELPDDHTADQKERQPVDMASSASSGICKHGRRRSRCKECGGSGMCEHGRERNKCKQCGGSGICQHLRRRSHCKECGGASICVHGRRHSRCKECGGGSICEHKRRRNECKECGGGSICAHGRHRTRCKECTTDVTSFNSSCVAKHPLESFHSLGLLIDHETHYSTTYNQTV